MTPLEDTFDVTLKRKGPLHLRVTRVQIPLAPLNAGTFNNAQGKTIRGVGHTIDLAKPDYFSHDDYVQHLYMILGRAQALEWSLFRNFPTVDGEPDFSVFEQGPPSYIAEFLHRLEDRGRVVLFLEYCDYMIVYSLFPDLLVALGDLQEIGAQAHYSIFASLRYLPNFPHGDKLPAPCGVGSDGKFTYESAAWEAAVRKSCLDHDGGAVKRRKYDPTKWKARRDEFCRTWQLDLAEVARPTFSYFREHGSWMAFAGEAGGGGDCFFLSFASVLMQARAVYPDLPVFDAVPVSSWDDRIAVAASLRKVVGRHLRSWDPCRFLGYIVTCIVSENVSGAWLDQWSMLDMVRKSPFEFIKDVEDVLGADIVGNTLVVRFAHRDTDGRVVRSKRVHAGVSALRRLQNAVAEELEKMGNSHWATDTDATALCRELNVRLIVAGNTFAQQRSAEGLVCCVCIQPCVKCFSIIFYFGISE